LSAVSLVAILAWLVNTPQQLGHRAPRSLQQSDHYKTNTNGEGSAETGLAAPVKRPSHVLDDASLFKVLLIALSSLSFWCVILCECGVLTIYYLAQFIPAFATLQLGASQSDSAFTMITFVLGSTIGSLVAGWAYDTYPSINGRLGLGLLYCLLLAGSSLSLPLLFAWESLSLEYIYATTAVSGVAYGAINYVMLTNYLTDFSGPKHSGSVINFVDMIGVGTGSIVQTVAGHLVDRAQYGAFLWLFFGVGLFIATVGTVFAVVHFARGGRTHNHSNSS
jgi:hypothetical protein